jgi:signal transduction histidine kinase
MRYFVEAERLSLSQVVDNVLNNAVKFSKLNHATIINITRIPLLSLYKETEKRKKKENNTMK